MNAMNSVVISRKPDNSQWTEMYTKVEDFLSEFYTIGDDVSVEDCEAATDFLMKLTGPLGPGSAGRPWAVLDWVAEESPSEAAFWAVMVCEWSGFDAIPHKHFEGLFDCYLCPPRNIPDEVKTPVTIYRGQSADDPKGLSWTLNRTVAEAFAHGHRGMRVRNPVVFEMLVDFEDIAFYTNDRNEEEVVLWAIPD